MLRLESVHRLTLALWGTLYEKIYKPSGFNCGMWEGCLLILLFLPLLEACRLPKLH